MLAHETLSGDSGWIAVGSVAAIPFGQGRCFKLSAGTIAIFRNRSGEVYALDAACPHRAGPLADGLLGDNTVICPLHGFKFSLRDGRGIDNDLSITRYQLVEHGGELFLRLLPIAAADADAP